LEIIETCDEEVEGRIEIIDEDQLCALLGLRSEDHENGRPREAAVMATT
jgi:hypothetical protein